MASKTIFLKRDMIFRIATAASQANLDYAIITDVLALRLGGAKCPARFQTRETLIWRAEHGTLSTRFI